MRPGKFLSINLCLASGSPRTPVYIWFNLRSPILNYNKAFEFHHFGCYSLVRRWEIAVHSEMPTPRGVVKLWSALRAYIDLTHAWWSPWTNRMLPTDGCGRPRGALFSSFLRSLGFQLVCFFVLLLLRWARALSWRHFSPSPLHLSACCSRAVPFFKKLRWQSSQLISPGRFALCLHLSGTVFILLLQEAQSVEICVLYTYMAVRLILCLKSCLLISSARVESPTRAETGRSL